MFFFKSDFTSIKFLSTIFSEALDIQFSFPNNYEYWNITATIFFFQNGYEYEDIEIWIRSYSYAKASYWKVLGI